MPQFNKLGLLPAARFILPINWKPPPLLALRLVLSFLVIPQIGRIRRGVVTLVTFILITLIELHHRSGKVCVREFNKSGAADVAGARFILPINWEPPSDGYPVNQPDQSTICQLNNPFTLHAFIHLQSLIGQVHCL